ncbi:hypothetical protein GEMRC1_010254 [Eukaryota sp. GEM-RC1]
MAKSSKIDTSKFFITRGYYYVVRPLRISPIQKSATIAWGPLLRGGASISYFTLEHEQIHSLSLRALAHKSEYSHDSYHCICLSKIQHNALEEHFFPFLDTILGPYDSLCCSNPAYFRASLTYDHRVDRPPPPPSRRGKSRHPFPPTRSLKEKMMNDFIHRAVQNRSQFDPSSSNAEANSQLHFSYTLSQKH